MKPPRRRNAIHFLSYFASFAPSRLISNKNYRERAKGAKGKYSRTYSLASWRLGGLIIFLALIRCAAHSQPQPTPQQVISGDTAPPPIDPLAINAEMYQLQMPFGANSRDESFWKLVDEDVLDVPTSQNLIRNGFRVGRARIADWPEFLKVLTNESAIKLKETKVMARPSYDDAHLPMSDVLPEELLFIYDDHGLTMRSFSDCQNILSLGFEWAPRKARTLRLTFCPMVMATQTRMDYSLADNPAPAKYLNRENYYDMHLTADIAPGEFLIIGTSTATSDPNRIASHFLTRDGPNRRYEQVILFVGDPGPMENMRFRRPRPTTR
jgi:hypothetical protein